MKMKSILLINIFIFTVSVSVIYANVANYLEVRPTTIKVTASSSLVEKNKPASFYGPEKSFDGKLETAWCSNEHGSKIKGEFIEYEIKPTAAVGLHFFPGVGKNQGLFISNNRIKKAKITYTDAAGESIQNIVSGSYRENDCTVYDWGEDDKKPVNADKPCGFSDYDARGFSVSFNEGRYKCIKKVRIEILEVYPGVKYDDTCIAEMRLLTPFGGAVPQDFTEFQKECEK